MIQLPQNMSEGGVQVHLRSVGEAAALKKSKFRIDGSKSIYEVEKFLRKQLKHEGSMFLFCGSGFSPTPDQILKDLFDVSFVQFYYRSLLPISS